MGFVFFLISLAVSVLSELFRPFVFIVTIAMFAFKFVFYFFFPFPSFFGFKKINTSLLFIVFFLIVLKTIACISHLLPTLS